MIDWNDQTVLVSQPAFWKGQIGVICNRDDQVVFNRGAIEAEPAVSATSLCRLPKRSVSDLAPVSAPTTTASVSILISLLYSMIFFIAVTTGTIWISVGFWKWQNSYIRIELESRFGSFLVAIFHLQWLPFSLLVFSVNNSPLISEEWVGSNIGRNFN